MGNIIIDKAEERGYSEHGGWLESNFSFSFADWYNPNKMGFGKLRVINDDIIKGGGGFPPHPHRDMEIITIVLKGAIAHEDSMGNREVVKAGEVQRMSAGTGIVHSEFNNSQTEDLNSLQIWVHTRENGIEPSYDQKSFDENKRENKFQLLVSPDGRENSVTVNQDLFFSIIYLDEETEYKKYLEKNGVYIFLLEGEIEVLGNKLNRRDAIGIKKEDNIKIKAIKKSKILIMEVPL